MESKLLLPQLDLIFKLIYGSKNSISSTESLLSSILETDLKIIDGLTDIDPNKIIKENDDKSRILELEIQTKDIPFILTEFRFEDDPHLYNAIGYFGMWMTASQEIIDDDFSALKKVAPIIITNCNVFPESSYYHSCFTFKSIELNMDLKHLTETHLFELGKLPKEHDGTELWTWMKFIGARNQEDLDLALKLNPNLQQSYDRLMELSADKRIRKFAKLRQKQLDDERARRYRTQ